jgi:hypothetical protein
VFPKNGDREALTALTDTIMIEPDAQRVTMTWRVARPLKKNMFEIAEVLVGKKGRGWWQERDEVTFPVRVILERLKMAEAAAESAKE